MTARVEPATARAAVASGRLCVVIEHEHGFSYACRDDRSGLQHNSYENFQRLGMAMLAANACAATFGGTVWPEVCRVGGVAK